MRFLTLIFFFCTYLLALAQQPVISLSGNTLTPPHESEEVTREKQEQLAEAEQTFSNNPADVDHIIWFGRRLAYAWEFDKAIQMFTYGINLYPDNPRLYRHRGHRFITTRQFDRAISDLETAARLAQNMPLEIEPDGQPNSKNIPLSNLHFNIYYHLGLAYYLTANYEQAAKAYRKCLDYSKNDDLLCATTDWLYMTLCRLSRMSEASQLLDPIKENMTIIENESYHQRLLMYKGLRKPEDLFPGKSGDTNEALNLITQGYGVANHYFCTGNKDQALDILGKILRLDNWAAFGYIAAEADLANKY